MKPQQFYLNKRGSHFQLSLTLSALSAFALALMISVTVKQTEVTYALAYTIIDLALFAALVKCSFWCKNEFNELKPNLGFRKQD